MIFIRRICVLSICLVLLVHSWRQPFSLKRKVLSMKGNDIIESFDVIRGLPAWLTASCRAGGFVTPTDVQRQAIPVILSGKDVVLEARTGSGKTLCYALPLLANIDPHRAAIQAVVVVPTRELGLQVAGVLKRLSAGTAERKISTMCVCDGSLHRRQTAWAAAQPPHIVVGNPSALQRLVDQDKLRLHAVRMVVVDEIDACVNDVTMKSGLNDLLSRHLSNSYHTANHLDLSDQLEYRSDRVFKDVSRPVTAPVFRGERQLILCSATVPQRKHFCDLCVRNGWTSSVPELLSISQDMPLPVKIRHEAIVCPSVRRLAMTAFLLKEHLQKSAKNNTQCMVFVDKDANIREYAQYLQQALPRQHVEMLSSDMNIEDRRQALRKYRDAQADVLVCTGLASRGIDIPETDLVIQMSLPSSAEEYLHRSGRTGRLDREGKVVTLVQEEEDFVVKRFMNELHFTMNKRVLIPKRS